MIEPNSSLRARKAYRAAHVERSRAWSQIVRRIFNRDTD